MTEKKTKTCTECKQEKSITEFQTDPRMADGYKTKCKDCRNVREAKRRSTNYASGLCACGKKAVEGKTHCQKCLDIKLAYSKRIHSERKEMGLCINCGGKPIKGKALCEKCRDTSMKSGAKRRAERKEKGLCPHCGKPAASNKVSCQDCLDSCKERHRQFNQKVVEHLGGKCLICGLETTDYEVYECHHVDTNEKEVSIANMPKSPKSWETTVVPELEKTVLLDKICHARLHAGRFPQEVIDSLIPGKRESHKVDLYLTLVSDLMNLTLPDKLKGRLNKN